MQLRVGDHKIVVRMAGFAVWERTITLSSGSAIVVNASLETSSTQATKPVDDKRIPNIATSDKPKAPPNELVSPPQPASTNVKQTQLNPTSPKIIEKVESTPKADDLKTVGKMEAAPPPPSPARG